MSVGEQTKAPLEIVRVDRITNDEYPVGIPVKDVGEAIEYADEETRRRKPEGDFFKVVQGNEVVYDPTKN